MTGNTDDTTTDTDDDRGEPTDAMTDGPTGGPTTETITLQFEVELDGVHTPAWESVLAAAPDAETARRTVASRVEFATGPKEALYRQYRMAEQQRQQVAEQMRAQGGAMQAARADGGDTDTETETEDD